MDQNCVFCKIARKEIPAVIVYEDNEILAFRDVNPVSPVHILIIPKVHIRTLNELNDTNRVLIQNIILTAKNLADNEGIAQEGYRLVSNCNYNAGQEVFHLHFHLMGGRKFAWPPG
ncbi:MAG: histidine triad nucleotide-binding protein [Candidatus Omnitrophica bacterium]|nr:histidine triad nucleotide-binding protein [Candidatus Omnitrophota bacterium]